MKKILAIALSALLLMTVCASLSASADGGFVVSLGNVEAAAGEDVAVNFTVDSNSGIWAVALDVAYDTSILTLKSVTFGPDLSELGFLGVEEGAETFQLNGTPAGFDNVTGTGVMATATFAVKDTAKAGDKADITVTFNENNMINADGDNVATTVNNGSVKVIEKTVEPSQEPTSTEPSTEPSSTEPSTEPSSTEEPAESEAPAASEKPADTTSPDTGSALPVAAIVLAAGSAAVLTFARKK